LSTLGGLLQQFAQDDPRLLFGLHRLAVSQPAAGQRIRARVNVNPETTTWQLL
jgi:hypothetical protein